MFRSRSRSSQPASCASSPPPSPCSSVSPSWPAPSSSPTRSVPPSTPCWPRPTTASTPTSGLRRRSTSATASPARGSTPRSLDTVAAVDGVDQAALRINGYAQLVGHDGKPVGDVAQEPGVRHQLGRPSTTSTRTSSPAVTRRRPTTRSSSTRPAPTRPATDPGDVATVLTKGEPAAVHHRRHRHLRRRGLAGGCDRGAVHRRHRHRAARHARPGRRDRRHRRPGVSQADLAAAVQARRRRRASR